MYRKTHKNEKLTLAEGSKEFIKWKDTIIFHEEIILAELCYELVVDQPYDLMLELTRRLRAPKRVAQAAWSVVNDTYKTTACLRYPMNELAAASFLIAFILSSEQIPPYFFREVGIENHVLECMPFLMLRYCCRIDGILYNVDKSLTFLIVG